MRIDLLAAALVASSVALLPGRSAATAMDAELLEKAKRAADAGLHYLRKNQAKDGSWSGSVGVTALGLRAFLENRRGYNESDGAFITAPVNFLLSHVRNDGSISESLQNTNYNTATALVALQATGNEDYAAVIARGREFLKKLQIDERDGYQRDHRYYGGIGYGGDERPDLSNMYIAVEALKATATDPQDPVWEKALLFINRSQNRSESNDLAWAANDGGFTYMPGYSPHGETGSYGGMTHAGLISLLFAGVDRGDPRIVAAYDWIRANYTLEENPGARGRQGLFYYFNAFAKSMYAYGEDIVVDTDGVRHNWRADLARRLLALQDEDGSWVNNDSQRWWEGDRNLVTAWSVIALNHVIR